MSTETVICLGCACGWSTFAPTTETAYEDHLDHYFRQGGGVAHRKTHEMAISQPINNSTSIRRIMKAERVFEEDRIAQVERRKSVEPLRLLDDGLGAFRGLWSAFRLWLMVIVAGVACWGLWVLR